MPSSTSPVPLSPDELLTLVNQQAATIEQLQQKIQWFEEQFHLARHRQFGASSERSVPQQPTLFNEAEAVCPVAEEINQTITYTRKKGGRKPIPRTLPIEDIEYRLPEEERTCVCGSALHEMSTEVRHEIKLIPAQAKIVRHIRYVYSCRNCEKNGIEAPIKTAKAPRPVIEKGLASPSAMAYVMTLKFVEGVPLYRQEQHFERMGVELSRGLMSNWMLREGAIGSNMCTGGCIRSFSSRTFCTPTKPPCRCSENQDARPKANRTCGCTGLDRLAADPGAAVL